MTYHILIKEKGLALVENWPKRHDYIDDQHQDFIDAYNQLRESALSKAIDIAPESEDLVYKLLTKIDTSYGLPKTGLVYPIELELDGKVEMFSNRDGHTQIAYFPPSETLNNNAPNSNDCNCTGPWDCQCTEVLNDYNIGINTKMEKNQYLQEILNKTESMKEDLVIKDIRKLVKKAMQNTVSPPTDKSQEEQRWISVKDILPEKNKSVLVFIPEEDEHCTTGMYDVGDKWVLLDDYRVPTCEVTYWRPMVNLPDDKTFNRVHITEDEDSINFLIHKLQKENHDMRVILSQYNFE